VLVKRRSWIFQKRRGQRVGCAVQGADEGSTKTGVEDRRRGGGATKLRTYKKEKANDLLQKPAIIIGKGARRSNAPAKG